jgi:hypothetical protein
MWFHCRWFGGRLLLGLVFVRIMIHVVVVVMAMAIGRFATCPQGTGVRSMQTALEFNGNLFVDRAGVRLFLVHAQFGQHVDDDAGLDLKFPSQLVNSNFLHRRELLDNSLQNLTLWRNGRS